MSLDQAMPHGFVEADPITNKKMNAWAEKLKPCFIKVAAYTEALKFITR
jgi:hypothetical protein